MGNAVNLIRTPLNVSMCESLVVEATTTQDQEQNELWDEDSLDLDLDENNEVKETEEVEKRDRESDSLTGSWEKVVDDSKEKDNENVAKPSQAVPVCESSGTALVPLQDQKQNELWEEDSLDLNLDKNNKNKETEEVEKRLCLNNDLAGTLEKVVLDASKEKNIGLVAKPSQDVPVCESLGTALVPLQDQKQDELWEEDSHDLNLDENNENKETEEVEKSDCLNNDLAGTLGKVVLDASKEKNIGIVATPPQDILMCESSGIALVPLQDQKQNELWEEDSLDLNLDENNEEKEKEEEEKNDCLNNDLAGTLEKVVLDASKENNIGIVAAPPQDI